MTETIRLAWIWATAAVLLALIFMAGIVLLVKINADRLRPAERRQYERQIEAVKACTRGQEVALCISEAIR